MTLPAGTAQVLTDTNPGAREKLAFKKELVTWKGADGWEMDGLLVYPAGYAAGKRVPLLVNVHGGPAGAHTNTFTAGTRLYACKATVDMFGLTMDDFVPRVEDHLQKSFIARSSTYILRRAFALSCNTHRTAGGFAGQYFLQDDIVAPVVAEVVNIEQ